MSEDLEQKILQHVEKLVADRKSASHWSLDKRIPISLIFAIIVQTVAVSWFLAQQAIRIDVLEEKVAFQVRDQGRLTRLEVQLEGVASDISELKDLVQRATRAASN